MSLLYDDELISFCERTPIPYLMCSNLVVSSLPDEVPISLFSHDLWQLGVYYRTGDCEYNLDFGLFYKYMDGDDRRIEFIKFLLYCIWRKTTRRPLCVTTLRRYFHLLLAVSEYCANNCLGFSDFFSSYDQLVKFRRWGKGKSVIKLSSPLLVKIATLNGKYIDVKLASYDSVIKIKSINVKESGRSQHPPLPPRLYALLIKGMEDEFLELSAVKDKVRSLVQEVCDGFGSVKPRSYRDVLISLDLLDFFECRGYWKSWSGIISLVNDVYYLVKTYIHTFSGMRDDEVNRLSNFCFHTKLIDGFKYSLIRGDTFKNHNGKAYRGVWVVSDKVEEYIKLLQYIVFPIYKSMGVAGEKYWRSPLFVSPGFILPFDASFGAFGSLATKVDLSVAHKFKSRLGLIIQEEDLHFLETIDETRAWRSISDFSIGGEWRLTTHQLRRSLALYATATGLVSIISLKRQLKHLSVKLTRYYSDGGSYLHRCWLNDRTHFSSMLRSRKGEAEAILYIVDVLMCNESISGGHGSWIEKNGPKFTIAYSKNDLLRRFRKGEMHYTQTPLGGCVSRTCEHRSLGRFLYCWGCDYSVIKAAAVGVVCKAQELLVSELDYSSIIYRTENEVLTKLIGISSYLSERKSK